METHVFIENKNFKTLNVRTLGHEKCKPNHSYTYAYTDFYIIHYVVKGCGKVYFEGECYPVKKGEIFIIKPGGVYNYIADENDPWEYIWIHFNGELAKIFDQLGVTEQFESNLFLEILNARNLQSTRTEFLTGKLYEIISVLFESRHYHKDYVKTVSDYIKANYRLKLYVEDIAESLNINRRYLSRIFKEKKGVTIQQYIIDYKIKKACEFLNHGFKVNEAASMVGYDDTFTFSKIFKKNTGCSPNKYIKSSSEVM